MQARILSATLCAALTLTSCAKLDSPTLPELTYDERDSIPSDVPLPNPGVNQRPVTGTKTLLVTVTHWQDGDSLNYPLIKQHTLSTDPDSLQSYIRAASGGQMALAGQVIEHTSGPRPEICKLKPGDPPPMPINLADAEGKEAAKAHGLNVESFDYRISVIDCGGNGSAWTPGRFVGIYGQSGGPHIYKHEFGHSLGYAHGATYIRCPKAGDVITAPGGCTTTSYGDTGDSVSGGATLYPANNRWYSGWLGNSQATVIARSGLYRLAKLGNEGPQLYLINRPGLTPPQIALEYRKPTPFDNFPPYDNRVTGVWIRFTTMGGSIANVQLDSTPESATTADPTLQPGKSFKDGYSGISIEVCGADDVGATMAIGINNEPRPSCRPTLAPPTVSTPRANQQVGYRPIVSGTGMPGTAVRMVRIANGHDRYDIGEAVVGPDGKWSAQLSSPLEEGSHSILAYTSNAGSAASTDVASPRFNVVATPTPPAISSPQPNATTGPFPVFSGTGVPGSTVSVERVRDGYLVGVVATALVDAEGNWSAQSHGQFAAGANRVASYQHNGDKQSPVSGGRSFNVVE